MIHNNEKVDVTWMSVGKQNWYIHTLEYCCLVTKSCPTLLSMGFPSQEYWRGLPFPFPEDLPNLGIKSTSLSLQEDFFTTEQYFLKHFLPFSKVINLSMVTLQAIYLPAVAIDKAIFSAQQVWRQIFFLTLQPLLVGIHKCLSEVYQLTDITLPSVWCLVFFFSPWEISDKEEVQIVGGSY